MFDKTKPYGEVYGGAPACYEQDGLLYDIHEQLVTLDELAKPEIEPPVRRKPGPKPKRLTQ